MDRVALVTGGNQGLGFALVKGLCGALGPNDVVYLAARSEERGRAALAEIGPVVPTLRLECLDVSDDAGVAAVADALRERHGGVDVVISNAAARITKSASAAEQVTGFIDTNNCGTTRMLRQFLPILRPGARFLVVASSFGQLRHIAEPLRARFDETNATLEGLQDVMDRYAASVREGRAASEGWPDWINIPSKIGQVASARIAARLISEERPGDAILVNAVCPGLVDTAASRPWFDDMSKAQSPDRAAVDLLWLALMPRGATAPHGELVQFRKVLPRV